METPENTPPETPSGAMSRTMRIDITSDMLSDVSVQKKQATPRHPTIRISRPKSAASIIGDSDFQQLLQNVYDGAVITDYSGRVIDTNVRLCQFLGYEHEEVCRLGIFDLLFGADETLLPIIRENLANTRFVLLQAYFVRKDGTVFPTETAINRLYLSGQDYLCFFVRDITLRRQAEEQLRTEHTAIQTAGSGIAIVDLDQYLTYINPAVQQMWGMANLNPEAPASLQDLFSDPSVGATIVQSVVDGQCWAGEVEARRRNGSLFHVQAAATSNVNSEDELVGIVLSFTDITERKRAEEQRELYAEQLRLRNSEMEADLVMAREVQLALLPRQFPVFPASAAPEDSLLRFSHLYRPSTTLGGDFFHVLPVSDYVAGVFTCDVMGHGLRASLITAIMRGLVEELKPVANDPGLFMTHLNREFMTILRDAEEFMFVTASYVLFDLEQRRITFTDAGHPSPVLLRRTSGVVTPVRQGSEPAGPALGIMEDSSYETQHHSLEEGDAVLIYTDGISEVEGANREEFGVERLLNSLRAHLEEPVEAILPALAADAEDFSEGRGFDDDVCLVVVQAVRLP